MDRIETVWKMRTCNMQEVKELAYDLEIPIPVAQVMLTRGIDSIEKAEQFLEYLLEIRGYSMSKY